jgi:hypothetical protein
MSAGRNVSPIGVQGNAWNAASVGTNGTSAVLDTWSCPFVSAFGNASAATTLTLQYSMDGTDFYAGPSVTLSGAGNFYINSTTAARYLRLLSSAAATITATLAAK